MELTTRSTPVASDRELERQVRAYLASWSVPTLQKIQVVVCGNRVVLRGRVHRFYEKQLCISSCLRVAGEHIVDDQIIVAPNDTMPESSGCDDVRVER